MNISHGVVLNCLSKNAPPSKPPNKGQVSMIINLMTKLYPSAASPICLPKFSLFLCSKTYLVKVCTIIHKINLFVQFSCQKKIERVIQKALEDVKQASLPVRTQTGMSELHFHPLPVPSVYFSSLGIYALTRLRITLVFLWSPQFFVAV